MNLDYETTIVKDTPTFRLVMKKWPANKPGGMFCVELTSISIQNNSDPIASSYQFFMTESELNLLSDALVK
jgi:hypothetical protein